jgi:hypothetical protein
LCGTYLSIISMVEMKVNRMQQFSVAYQKLGTCQTQRA